MNSLPEHHTWINWHTRLGTGFSRGVPVHTEDQVAADMETFFEKFFEKYPKYATLPFYIFGESYAGHYVPAIASRLMGSTNLKGAAVGNGLTDPAIQYQWYVPFAEEHDLVSPATLKLMKGVEKLCEPLVKSCENDDADDDTKKIATWSECLNAYIVCNVGLVTPIQASGLNVYDVRLQCGDDPLCYDFSDVDDYLNRDDVKEALGVTKNWKECSKLVDLVMVYGGDWMKSYKANVKALLDNGISVLIYAGEYDFICNWMGNFAWTQALEWSGQDAFNNAPNSSFYLTSQVPCTAAAAEADAIMASPQVEKRRRSLFDCVLSTEAGSYVSAKNFTFLKVKDAGHLSPMDQPEATLEMVRRFTLNAGGWAG
mmetsp:Transcript_7880/g.25874  ORF Transcript_7880/g.25874 Transcript_7880/m.25874 type:complete len:370 (-) Transcript_7880:159-1268(-)